MIEAPIAIAEAGIAILAAAAEISVAVIVASIGAWRYVLSPSYRIAVNAKLAIRHTFYRNAVKVAGGAFVVLSIPALVYVAWVLWRWAIK